jgi:hypothetical protein
VAPDAACSCASAAPFLPAAFAGLRKALVDALETAGRSASRIAQVHAAFRPLLETGRGQGDPQRLDLFASVHHHRCVVRGQRAGLAPLAILTGTALAQTWLPSR